MNDLIKHFIAGAAVTLIVLILFAIIPHGELYNWDKGIAVLAGWLVAAAKELIWDMWLKKGDPDYYDFFWGVCGSAAAMFLWVITSMVL